MSKHSPMLTYEKETCTHASTLVCTHSLLNLQVITVTYYMTKTYLGTGRDMKGLSETYVFTVW